MIKKNIRLTIISFIFISSYAAEGDIISSQPRPINTNTDRDREIQTLVARDCMTMTTQISFLGSAFSIVKAHAAGATCSHAAQIGIISCLKANCVCIIPVATILAYNYQSYQDLAEIKKLADTDTGKNK